MARSGARNQLGQHGEQLAAEFLVAKGYEILEQNLVLKQGEIDMLMRDGSTIVLVEVKTQRSALFVNPIFKIDQAKQRKLWLLARVISARYPTLNVRIDAVTVTWESGVVQPIITHLQNVI